MFLHLSVSHSVHGGGGVMMSIPVVDSTIPPGWHPHAPSSRKGGNIGHCRHLQHYSPIHQIACNQQECSPESIHAAGSHSPPIDIFQIHRNFTSQSHRMARSCKPGSFVKCCKSAVVYLETQLRNSNSNSAVQDPRGLTH